MFYYFVFYLSLSRKRENLSMFFGIRPQNNKTFFLFMDIGPRNTGRFSVFHGLSYI